MIASCVFERFGVGQESGDKAVKQRYVKPKQWAERHENTVYSIGGNGTGSYVYECSGNITPIETCIP